MPLIGVLLSSHFAFSLLKVQHIVSVYRLDDWVSISGRGKGFFSSLCVQTGAEAHQVSYALGAGVLFPR
jgi:hypothetical protein